MREGTAAEGQTGEEEEKTQKP